MDFLARIQRALEEKYGAHTGTDVREFVRTPTGLAGHGKLLIDQDSHNTDINIAVLLDRDILAAWESRPRDQLNSLEVSVPFEEVSHFVYLAWNHSRGRNVTALEMEMQSEIDRILLAFHGDFALPHASAPRLLADLLDKPYENSDYEVARHAAAKFIRNLSGGDPLAWTEKEFRLLRDFFHSDLSRKLSLSREVGRRT